MANNDTPMGRFWNAKRDARTRGLAWRLSDRHALRLFAAPCHWCGAEGPNGIDRISNERYYSDRNAVPCCWTCNAAKKTMTCRQWLEFIYKVHAQCEQENRHAAIRRR
jgi:hypothetical protein